MTIPVVFVHGSGRAGRAAWPLQARTHPDARFLVLPGFGSHDEPVVGIDAAVESVRVAVGDGAVVVASSFGSIAAARLATESSAVKGLVLAEPALYAIARGRPAVEHLIARMDPVYARRDSTAVGEWWAEAITTLTGHATDAPNDPDGLRTAARFAAQGAPWHYAVDVAELARTPMTVVTGGWNAEYDEIAAVLQSVGARWSELPGYGHRVADHPDFSPLIDSLLTRIADHPRYPEP